MKSIQLYLVAFLFFFSAQFSFAQNKQAPKPPQNINAKIVKQETKAVKNVSPQKTVIKKPASQNISKKKLTKQIDKKEGQPLVVTINNKEYFTINNVWFTKEEGKYKKVDKPQEQQTAPENKIVSASEQKTELSALNEPVVITYNNQKYHVFRGYWFTNTSGTYKKVNAPIGVQLQALPSNIKEEILNGETYYSFENTRYKKVGNFYEVVAF